jgi:hypothetical protein
MNKADWSVQDAIKERVEKEAWYDWAQKPATRVVRDYRPVKVRWSETARYVFGQGIYYVKLLKP